jgi:D-sedoheptulose 7-phosphate isomerase
MEERILRLIQESREVHDRIAAIVPQIKRAATLMTGCIENHGKIMFAGNGGSASDAQHLAAELVNRFRRDRRPLAGLALSTDSSILTSIANDYSFEQVFSKQLQALGRKGDIFFGISTSGESANIIRAVADAREMGITTIGLTGENGRIKDLVDCPITVGSRSTARIQEAHILIGHILCELLEDAVCPGV